MGLVCRTLVSVARECRRATFRLGFAFDAEQGKLSAPLGRLLRPPRRSLFNGGVSVDVEDVCAIADYPTGREIGVVWEHAPLASENRLALAVLGVAVSAAGAGLGGASCWDR